MNSNFQPDKDPQIWLQAAESDLSIARSGKPTKDVRYDELCYHCVQAVEKSLKALMVKKFNEYEWGHDLKKLIVFLKAKELLIPSEIENAISSPINYGGFQFPFEFPLSFDEGFITLSELETSRYPPEKYRRSINIVAYTRALERAEIIVSWVKKQF